MHPIVKADSSRPGGATDEASRGGYPVDYDFMGSLRKIIFIANR
jgi:hypothetical protein